jgi:HSP20 family molecular chaperone IbpA
MKNPRNRKPHWAPRTDIFIAKSGDLIVEIELSAMRADDMEIVTDDSKLIIKGKRQNTGVADAQTVLVNDIPAGHFEAILDFPPGFDLSRAASAYLSGLLRITVPPVKHGGPGRT